MLASFLLGLRSDHAFAAARILWFYGWVSQFRLLLALIRSQIRVNTIGGFGFLRFGFFLSSFGSFLSGGFILFQMLARGVLFGLGGCALDQRPIGVDDRLKVNTVVAELIGHQRVRQRTWPGDRIRLERSSGIYLGGYGRSGGIDIVDQDGVASRDGGWHCYRSGGRSPIDDRAANQDSDTGSHGSRFAIHIVTAR